MARDTLPLHQTVSILSVFLIIGTLAVTIYAASNTYWMLEKFSTGTQIIGKILKEESEPFIIPGTKDKTKPCGGVFRDLANALANNTNGRMYLDVQAGLKTFCIYIKFKGFQEVTDLLPKMHYCRTYDVWDNFGEKREAWKNDKANKKLFDDVIDAASEVADLMTATLSLLSAASVTSLLKTPLITNVMKSRKIFRFTTFLFIIGAVISTTWGLILFAKEFDPKTLLDVEIRRNIEKHKKEDILRQVTLSQKFGKCFYMTIAVDCMLVVLAVFCVVEYILSTKQQGKHRIGVRLDEDKNHMYASLLSDQDDDDEDFH